MNSSRPEAGASFKILNFKTALNRSKNSQENEDCDKDIKIGSSLITKGYSNMMAVNGALSNLEIMDKYASDPTIEATSTKPTELRLKGEKPSLPYIFSPMAADFGYLNSQATAENSDAFLMLSSPLD